ncbi:MAG: hypothetical protein WCH78_03865 [Bacteroidota bacterium]
MKKLFLIFSLFIAFSCFGQKTNKYAGLYSYGANIEKERIGNMIIYPETDSTILFYLDANRGAPSYNMGMLYGSVKIKNNAGIYYFKFDHEARGCKLSFAFSTNKLTIKTIENNDGCLMGKGVYPDAVFNRKSNKLIEYFEDPESRKVYFNQTKPKDYYHN